MAGPTQIRLPPRGKRYREVRFGPAGGMDDAVHLLGIREIRAVNVALAAGRPLLVRGEPGVGKSQLARAAAHELKRSYVSHVIDSTTELRELMWTFDAVRRLAEAQLAGALKEDPKEARTRLEPARFIHPGPLWWAFNRASACDQYRCCVDAAPPDGGNPANGCVLLLDEIDKAESEVPNGLLEALGARRFAPAGLGREIQVVGPPPLVIITTNEERALPDAFLRRCLILRLELPSPQAGLVDFLCERGKAHFADLDDGVLHRAAVMLQTDRQEAIARQINPRPGLAEFLDLLRAVRGIAPGKPDLQLEELQHAAEFTIQKHAGTVSAD